MATNPKLPSDEQNLDGQNLNDTHTRGVNQQAQQSMAADTGDNCCGDSDRTDRLGSSQSPAENVGAPIDAGSHIRIIKHTQGVGLLF